MECKVYRLGQIEFQKAWNLQNQLAEQIADGSHPPALLLMEHSHVYTFGRQGKDENLLWSEQELKERGVDVHWIDRGGDITYHGPGQLVGYPLLPLADGNITIDPETGNPRLPKSDYVGYLRKLEKMVLQTLFHFGIVGGQIEGQTGVWIQGDVPSQCIKCPPNLFKSPAKIASIGVKVDSKGISRHGFALNINPDMTYWDGILACGLENQNKASLAYFLEPLPTMDEVVESIIDSFGRVFDYELERHEGVLLI